MTYHFQDQLTIGQQYEAQLDAMFADRFTIVPATPQQQRQGIDRVYRPHDKPQNMMTVEYKADITAASTGNAFVEIVSVDTAKRPGWAIASEAEWLMYFVPAEPQVLYIIRFEDLHARIARWQRTYEQRRIPNDGYHTVGLLVPLAEFEAIASVVW
ncbi:MAG: hypothetical protein IPM06_19925 [Rhizobiales bacterium]|nr:hypothetical protein [Hyphomicrobiales bacterium]